MTSNLELFENFELLVYCRKIARGEINRGITPYGYLQKTEITPNPIIASPPATNANIPSPPPIPAIAIPHAMVSASPKRRWFFISEI